MKTIYRSSTAILLIATVLSLSACNTSQRKDVGMVAGGVVGGVAGSALTHGSPAGAIVGAVGGAFVGRSLTN
jgi:osmotically inducible lipoprotein OsmB